MHARARDLVMACGGGRIYEIKTLRSNLAPEEGGGAFIRGGRIIEPVRYVVRGCVPHAPTYFHPVPDGKPERVVRQYTRLSSSKESLAMRDYRSAFESVLKSHDHSTVQTSV